MMREQVGVAAALAVAVHRALHLARAGVDGDEAVGHGAVAVVVDVDADAARRAPAVDLADDARADERRQGGAVGVAEADDRRRPPRRRRVTQRQRVVGVVARRRRRSARRRRRPSCPAPTQEAHRVGDHAQVLVAARRAAPCVRCRSQVLPTMATVPAKTRPARAGWRRPRPSRPCAAVMPKAASSALLEPLALHARGRTPRPWGWRPGKPPSMKCTPSSSSLSAMRTFSSTETHMPSRCMPSRRVVSYSLHGTFASCSPRWPCCASLASRRQLRRGRGSARTPRRGLRRWRGSAPGCAA